MSEAQSVARAKTAVSRYRWTVVSAIIGVMIFISNATFAGFLIWRARETIGQPIFDPTRKDSIVAGSIEKLKDASPGEIVYFERLMRAEVQTHLMSKRYLLIIVSLVFAFGLSAIGFSLFVMGLEGSLNFEASGTPLGKVALQATYPGLLCFLLATVIVCVALMQRLEMNFGAFSVGPTVQTSGQPAGAAQTASFADVAKSLSEINAASDSQRLPE